MIDIDQDLVIESLLKTRNNIVFVLMFRGEIEGVYRDYNHAKDIARYFSIAASKSGEVKLVVKELN